MVRRTPQSLGGPIQISPVATPQDTFVSGSKTTLSQGEIIDFTPFSQVLASYVGQKEREALEDTAEIVRTIGQRQEKGDDLEDILKDYSSDNSTPTRVKTKLAKLFNEQGIDVTANPAYLAQYYTGKGEIRYLAARGELLTDKSLAEIAQAGKDAPEGQATQAMLGAIKARVEKFSLYDGLGALGQQAIDKQMAGLFGETLNAAEGVYQDQVKADVRETFGGSMLVASRQMVALPNLKAASLKGMGDAYTQLRASGEPNHREILIDSLLAAAEDVHDTNGPEAAAEYLDDIVDEFSEGTSKVFNGEEAADLIDRGRLLSVKDAYARSVDSYKASKRAELAEQKAETERQMGIQHGAQIALLTSASAQEINDYFNGATQGLYSNGSTEADAFVDPAELFVKQEWLQEQRLKTLQQRSAQSFDDEEIVGDLQLKLARGQTNQALQILNDLQGSGRMTNGTLAKFYEEVKVIRETPAVIQSSAYQNLDSEVYRVLSGAEAFLLDTGQPDPSKINPVVLEITGKIRQEITDQLVTDGDRIRQEGAGKWVREYTDRRMRELSADHLTVKPTGGGEAQVVTEFKAKEFAARVEAGTPVTLAPTLGGLATADQPNGLRRVQSILNKPVERPAAGIANMKVGGGPLTLKEVAAERTRTTAEYLDDFLADADVVDSKGTKLTKGQKSRAVAEAIAYSGLSMGELISGKLNPSTVAAWATEDRPALTAEISEKRLDLSGVDLLNTPVEESLALLPYIIFGENRKPIGLRNTDGSLDKEVRQLQALLPKYGLPSDDESVLRFVMRQYELMSTIRPDQYKK
jgi:hypothetical protein